MFVNGEIVTLLTPTSGTDRYGDTAANWTAPEATAVPGCAVAPRASTETTADGDRVIIGLTVYLPPGTAVTSKQRVVVRGETYEVVGEPGEWRSPYTGWAPGTEIALQRVEG